MKNFISVLMLFSFLSTPVFSQEVGIEFETMNIGTKLTTTSMGYYEATYIDEYIGKNDGYFQTQTYKLLEDGSTKELNLVSYDEKGRKVLSTLDGKTNTYTPYSCHYVVGKCTHTYKYYNSLTKKYVTNEGKFDNRLDGDTLYVGVIQSDGDMFEVPFVLGPHRLRVSSENIDALGTKTGHIFVQLDIPE